MEGTTVGRIVGLRAASAAAIGGQQPGSTDAAAYDDAADARGATVRGHQLPECARVRRSAANNGGES